MFLGVKLKWCVKTLKNVLHSILSSFKAVSFKCGWYRTTFSLRVSSLKSAWFTCMELLWSRLINNCYKGTFFSLAVFEWNKLDPCTCNESNFGFLKKYFELNETIVQYNIPLLQTQRNQLCLVLAQFCEYIFKHTFQDFLDRICGFIIELTLRFFIPWTLYANKMRKYLSNNTYLDSDIP